MSQRSQLARVLSIAPALFVTVATVGVAATTAAQATGAFAVRSTLAGTKVLPHRIRWLGIPNLPPNKVAEVTFLIDDHVRWVEHNSPYSFGYDGNYLVTSWLSPGEHRFAVRAKATDGRVASTSIVARVRPATPPPAQLAGRWVRTVAGGPEQGTWRLEIDKVGWRFRGRGGAGAFVDVAYLSPRLLEARGGIHTKNRDDREGNSWCNEPFQPVKYHWSVNGHTLVLTLAGQKACDGESTVWAGEWTRP